MSEECDFGDKCEGELKEAHEGLADIARTIEAAGGNCDGDEGIPDVTRGVSNLVDSLKEDLAALESSLREIDERVKALEDKLDRVFFWTKANSESHQNFSELAPQVLKLSKRCECFKKTPWKAGCSIVDCPRCGGEAWSPAPAAKEDAK